MSDVVKSIVHDYAPLLSVALSALLSLLAYALRAKVKLIWGQANNSYHQIKTEPQLVGVYCEKHYLQNLGRKPATNVEFVLSHPPTEISIWQARDYTKKPTPEGQFMLVIPQIAPRELIIIDTIYVNLRTADVISVKNGETIGKRVTFRVERYFGKVFATFVILLFLGGAAFYLSLIIRYFI